jgi:hypothetical protein
MKVSWDDYSQYMKKHVPNHQAVFIFMGKSTVFRCSDFSNTLWLFVT